LEMTWEEIGYLAQGFAFSSRPLKEASRTVTDEFSLGPRGAWILILISNGQVYPLDLTNVFRVGRSIITAELIRLNAARLITYRQGSEDRRRVELALTSLGATTVQRVRDEMSRLIQRRLAHYSRDEVLTCARLLNDFIMPRPEEATHASKVRQVKRSSGSGATKRRSTRSSS